METELALPTEKRGPVKTGKKIAKEIFDWTRALLVAVVLALLLNTFVFQTYRVQGESMLPTIHEQEYAMIFKMYDAYDYGDVIIVDSRVDRVRTLKDRFSENGLLASVAGWGQDRHIWIKRVIGLPGDTLEFRGNQLYRNGALLEENYIYEAMRNNPDRIIEVPQEHLFVMGDNRNRSGDSRDVGAIPYSHLIGKAINKK